RQADGTLIDGSLEECLCIDYRREVHPNEEATLRAHKAGLNRKCSFDRRHQRVSPSAILLNQSLNMPCKEAILRCLIGSDLGDLRCKQICCLLRSNELFQNSPPRDNPAKTESWG